MDQKIRIIHEWVEQIERALQRSEKGETELIVSQNVVEQIVIQTRDLKDNSGDAMKILDTIGHLLITSYRRRDKAMFDTVMSAIREDIVPQVVECVYYKFFMNPEQHKINETTEMVLAKLQCIRFSELGTQAGDDDDEEEDDDDDDDDDLLGTEGKGEKRKKSDKGGEEATKKKKKTKPSKKKTPEEKKERKNAGKEDALPNIKIGEFVDKTVPHLYLRTGFLYENQVHNQKGKIALRTASLRVDFDNKDKWPERFRRYNTFPRVNNPKAKSWITVPIDPDNLFYVGGDTGANRDYKNRYSLFSKPGLMNLHLQAIALHAQELNSKGTCLLPRMDMRFRVHNYDPARVEHKTDADITKQLQANCSTFVTDRLELIRKEIAEMKTMYELNEGTEETLKQINMWLSELESITDAVDFDAIEKNIRKRVGGVKAYEFWTPTNGSIGLKFSRSPNSFVQKLPDGSWSLVQKDVYWVAHAMQSDQTDPYWKMRIEKAFRCYSDKIEGFSRESLRKVVQAIRANRTVLGEAGKQVDEIKALWRSCLDDSDLKTYDEYFTATGGSIDLKSYGPELDLLLNVVKTATAQILLMKDIAGIFEALLHVDEYGMRDFYRRLAASSSSSMVDVDVKEDFNVAYVQSEMNNAFLNYGKVATIHQAVIMGEMDEDTYLEKLKNVSSVQFGKKVKGSKSDMSPAYLDPRIFRDAIRVKNGPRNETDIFEFNVMRPKVTPDMIDRVHQCLLGAESSDLSSFTTDYFLANLIATAIGDNSCRVVGFADTYEEALTKPLKELRRFMSNSSELDSDGANYVQVKDRLIRTDELELHIVPLWQMLSKDLMTCELFSLKVIGDSVDNYIQDDASTTSIASIAFNSMRESIMKSIVSDTFADKASYRRFAHLRMIAAEVYGAEVAGRTVPGPLSDELKQLLSSLEEKDEENATKSVAERTKRAQALHEEQSDSLGSFKWDVHLAKIETDADSKLTSLGVEYNLSPVATNVEAIYAQVRIKWGCAMDKLVYLSHAESEFVASLRNIYSKYRTKGKAGAEPAKDKPSEISKPEEKAAPSPEATAPRRPTKAVRPKPIPVKKISKEPVPAGEAEREKKTEDVEVLWNDYKSALSQIKALVQNIASEEEAKRSEAEQEARLEAERKATREAEREAEREAARKAERRAEQEAKREAERKTKRGEERDVEPPGLSEALRTESLSAFDAPQAPRRRSNPRVPVSSVRETDDQFIARLNTEINPPGTSPIVLHDPEEVESIDRKRDRYAQLKRSETNSTRKLQLARLADLMKLKMYNLAGKRGRWEAIDGEIDAKEASIRRDLGM